MPYSTTLGRQHFHPKVVETKFGRIKKFNQKWNTQDAICATFGRTERIGHSIEKGVPSEPFLVEQNIRHSIEKGVPSEPFFG